MPFALFLHQIHNKDVNNDMQTWKYCICEQLSLAPFNLKNNQWKWGEKQSRWIFWTYKWCGCFGFLFFLADFVMSDLNVRTFKSSSTCPNLITPQLEIKIRIKELWFEQINIKYFVNVFLSWFWDVLDTTLIEGLIELGTNIKTANRFFHMYSHNFVVFFF